MPNSNQAKKRLRQDERRRIHNRAIASRMKTEIKKVLKLCEEGDAAAAEQQLPEAFRRIDKAAKKNILHAKNASRKKSRLSRAIQSVRS